MQTLWFFAKILREKNSHDKALVTRNMSRTFLHSPLVPTNPNTGIPRYEKHFPFESKQENNIFIYASFFRM